MNLKRLCFSVALIALLIVPGISSAATFTLQQLQAAAQTVFLNEGGFDHDLGNPLQITISNATWAAGSIGDFRMIEAAGSTNLSDLVRFVNVGGVANIYFGSDDNGTVPLTGPLSGPSPGFTTILTETSPASSFPEVLTTTNGWTVNARLTSDSDPTAAGALSDHITLSATPPPVAGPVCQIRKPHGLAVGFSDPSTLEPDSSLAFHGGGTPHVKFFQGPMSLGKELNIDHAKISIFFSRLVARLASSVLF